MNLKVTIPILAFSIAAFITPISSAWQTDKLEASKQTQDVAKKPTEQKQAFKAGKVTTVVDEINGGAGGLSIDKDGNLYTADFGWRLDGKGKGGHQIFKVSPKGKVTRFCTSLRGGSGNTFDSKGNLYQSNIGTSAISKIEPNGKVHTFCSKGLRNPVGLVWNRKSELFASCCGGNFIAKVNNSGKATVFSKGKLFKTPNGITIGNDGTLYVCNFSNGDVIKIDQKGQPSKLATIPGGANGHLTFYRGFLYVIARNDCGIYRVSLEGKVTHFAGTGKRGYQDGPGLKSSFSLPNSIAVSNDGKFLYINETSPTKGDPRILGPTRIRKIELIPDTTNEQ